MSELMAIIERLRAMAPKGLARFLTVGLIGLTVDSVLFSFLLHLVHFDKAIARAISMPIATSVTWVLNRRLTFQATGRRKRVEVGRYAVVTACAQGISYGIFMAVCTLLPKQPPLYALFVGAVIAAGFSYSGQRFFTFAPAAST
ncbi:MAG: GtrA family protein [Caulobacteraceae bacterium]